MMNLINWYDSEYLFKEGKIHLDNLFFLFI
jgi:hypothetical protein